MRKLIKENKKDWIEMDNLTGTEYEIQRWLHKLDIVASEYESRWGVSRLHTLVPYEVAAKWNVQVGKLNDAIKQSKLELMPDLVEGTIRGYAALERAAIAEGHKPHDAPFAWTVGLPSGKTLAIVRHDKDAALVNDLKCDHGDVVVWTIDEIARIIEKDHTLVNLPKEKAGSVEARAFDFSKGDSLPDEFK